MKNNTVYIVLFLFAVLMFSGCATTGIFPSANLTNVELSENNFNIIAKNVSGEASAEYLLGFSGGLGAEMRTLALIRINGDGFLFRTALAELWKNFEDQHGSVEGRHLALVNVRYDFDGMNVLGLYTKPTVSIRADVVEFVE